MSTAIVQSPKEKRANIEKALMNALPNMKALMPARIKPDELLRCVTSAMSKTPDLVQCSPLSIVLATAQAASLGLRPNTPSGEGWIVPYGKTATFVPGYRGLVFLATQSREITKVEARVVYALDAFEVRLGTDPAIHHVPRLDDKRGAPMAFYAVATFKDGTTQFEPMTVDQVEAIKNRSKAAKDGPWVTDFEEMGRKTVVRRLCKYLPVLDDRLARATELSDNAETGTADFSDVIDAFGEVVNEETGEVIEARPSETSRAQAMADRLQQKAANQ